MVKIQEKEAEILLGIVSGAEKVFVEHQFEEGFTEIAVNFAKARNNVALNTRINTINELVDACKTKNPSKWNKFIDILKTDVKIPGLKYFN
ncbi:hypothetical protein PP175_25785 (plasmid) [Aneurinibacillus sp. Ricciae_BoGa-3]|uniref:hypothetical protein n=1 Tax=Aneurinibacillus sp. Ricciae_BoGa-3 TaxID=3022697 RepID=UPI0023412FB8|nr:hypothetical protein [Aneurinibacillus sp. Ricciae_BoGa-3]WCK57480.1 hypothetical protein PP175_25785 [Aneurinibacillus sp. Ricciae_BoGa-3]